jgi:hypothetical protein
LGHYRALSSPTPALVGLMRDDSREGRLSFSEQPVGNPAGPLRITRRSSVLDFGQIRWPSEGADFLKLRVRLNYPFWWRVRKPSKLTLRIFLADGSGRSLEFVVEPNRTSDVWIYPWDDRQLGSYFQANESEWRPYSQPPVVGMQLFITPFDWISVVPESIGVEEVDAVRVSLRPVGIP